jgi:hypothetical protein
LVGLVTITGSAGDPEDDSLIVEVRTGGGAWQPAVGGATWSYAWNTSSVVDGTYQIQARAFDGTLYSETCSVSVVIDNGNAATAADLTWLWILLLVVILVVVLLALWFRRRKPKEAPAEAEAEEPKGDEEAAEARPEKTDSEESGGA